MPSPPPPFSPPPPMHCELANWATSFDRAGWSMCPYGEGMQQLWRNSCDDLYCLEYAMCCKLPAGSQTCVEKDILHAFDSAGWVDCPSGTYMKGLYRSDADQKLNSIEKMECCHPPDGIKLVRGPIQDVSSSFDHLGWSG